MFKVNDKNLEFYKKISIGSLKEIAEAGGFSTCKDLELIYPQIADSEVLLEIGAGYGRCLDFLIHKNFQGRILALENSPPFVHYLKEHYRQYSNIEIIEGDIKKPKLPDGISNALWMWSGIIDFSRDQQLLCLKHLYKMLVPGGKVFMDIPRKVFINNIPQLGFQNVGDVQDEKHLTVDTPYGPLVCYIPDRADMEEYRSCWGYSSVDFFDYETATDKKRTIFILTK